MATSKLKRANGKINKSAWIRSQPVSLSAQDVLKKAQQAGITLSLAQVYTARSTANKFKGSSASAPARPAQRAARATPTGLEAEFMSLALRLGTAKAEELLRSL